MIDKYSTHIPVLEKACEVFHPKDIIEHGCGYYSTPLFRKYGYVKSIEHDNEWKEKINERYEVNIERGTDFSGCYLSAFDLAFVDGLREGRLRSIQQAQECGVKVIIYHDAEKEGIYGYDKIKLGEYKRVIFKHECGKCTAVMWLGEEKVNEWEVDDHTVV